MASDRPKSIDALADLLRQTQKSIYVTNDLKKRHFGPITGVIVAINDPQEKGRVKVKLDPFRQNYIVEDWIPVVGAYSGVQPRLLIGQKVLVAPIEGNTFLYRVIGIIDGDLGTYDPITNQGELDQHIDSNDYSTLSDLKPMTALSGTMMRLPVYSIIAGDALPRCHAKNQGVIVILDDGLNSYFVTCLRYRGGFGWITTDRKKFDNNFGLFN